MHVNNEITHVRVVDRCLRLGLPGDIGFGIIWVDTDDI